MYVRFAVTTLTHLITNALVFLSLVAWWSHDYSAVWILVAFVVGTLANMSIGLCALGGTKAEAEECEGEPE